MLEREGFISVDPSPGGRVSPHPPLTLRNEQARVEKVGLGGLGLLGDRVLAYTERESGLRER